MALPFGPLSVPPALGLQPLLDMSGYGILKPDKFFMRTQSGKPIAKQVRRRIEETEPGAIFLVRDFLDLGSQETITRTLSRLQEDGVIRRLQRGVYDSPRVSVLLGKPVPPDPAQIAAALARRAGGEIIASEARSASLLGLTTQVPAKNVFQTNGGKTRRVQVGDQTVELRRVSARHFAGRRSDATDDVTHEKAEAVIQGLRFIGEGNVTLDILHRVRGELTERQRAALRARLGDAPAWMHPILWQLARQEDTLP